MATETPNEAASSGLSPHHDGADTSAPMMAPTPSGTADADSAPSIEDALRLAIEAHHGSSDAAGEPKILHPLRLLARVSSEEERLVAILHDALEDSDLEADDLRRRGFREDVVDAVDRMTKRPDQKDDELESAYLRRVSESPLAARVKLLDLEDNIQTRLRGDVSDEDLRGIQKRQRQRMLLTSYLEARSR
jgi:(p)ppGpp synthase/HD superfamily hydrolase